MHTLEITGVAQSTYVRTVRIACEEKGVAYRLTPVLPHSPRVAAIHPLGKIPVLSHGEVRLFESRAIVGYLARVFPGPKLFADDAVQGAQIEQWVSMANSAIIPKLNVYLQSYFRPDARKLAIILHRMWRTEESFRWGSETEVTT